jgi:Flp pilus assembly pilin Flp
MVRLPSITSSSRKKSLGQGMTEYIIIVGVIAVAAIGTFGYFGDVLENQTAGMAAELSGGDGNAAKLAAQGAAGDAATTAGNHNDLSNYDDNGQAATAAP